MTRRGLVTLAVALFAVVSIATWWSARRVVRHEAPLAVDAPSTLAQDASSARTDALDPVHANAPAREHVTPDESEVFTLSADADLPSTLVAGDPQSISGVVVDEAGLPAHDVVVHGRNVAGDSLLPTTTTDARGAFVLPLNVLSPHWLEIPASAAFEAHGDKTLGDSPLFDPGTVGVRVVLKRQPKVTFRVVDAVTRQPITSFGLSLSNGQSTGPSFAYGFRRNVPRVDDAIDTHANGEVRLTARAGETSVDVWARHHARYGSMVQLDAGSSDVQTIALAPECTITGRAVANGTPAAGTVVTLQRQWSTRDLDAGATASSNEAPEPRTPSNAGSTDRRRAVGRGNVNIGSWRPRADGPVVGDPILGEDFTTQEGTATTDDQGRFEFGELAAGTYTLELEHSGSAETFVRDLRLSPGRHLDVGDVALTPGATIRGRLIVPSNETPSGYSVVATRATPPGGRTDNSLSSLYVGADGAFAMQGLSAGDWTVDWIRPNELSVGWQRPARLGSTVVHVEAGQVYDVVLDASHRTPCRIDVLVVRGDAPAEDMRVDMTWVRDDPPAASQAPSSLELRDAPFPARTDDSFSLGSTNADGHVVGTVEGTARFTLTVRDPMNQIVATRDEPLVAIPGATVTCTIVVRLGRVVLEIPPSRPPELNGMIDVRLTRGDAPIANYRLFSEMPAIGRPFGPEWKVGNVRLGDVPPGDYHVSVVVSVRRRDRAVQVSPPPKPGPGSIETDITVREGASTTIVMP